MFNRVFFSLLTIRNRGHLMMMVILMMIMMITMLRVINIIIANIYRALA